MGWLMRGFSQCLCLCLLPSQKTELPDSSQASRDVRHFFRVSRCQAVFTLRRVCVCVRICFKIMPCAVFICTLYVCVCVRLCGYVYMCLCVCVLWPLDIPLGHLRCNVVNLWEPYQMYHFQKVPTGARGGPLPS